MTHKLLTLVFILSLNPLSTQASSDDPLDTGAASAPSGPEVGIPAEELLTPKQITDYVIATDSWVSNCRNELNQALAALPPESLTQTLQNAISKFWLKVKTSSGTGQKNMTRLVQSLGRVPPHLLKDFVKEINIYNPPYWSCNNEIEKLSLIYEKGLEGFLERLPKHLLVLDAFVSNLDRITPVFINALLQIAAVRDKASFSSNDACDISSLMLPLAEISDIFLQEPFLSPLIALSRGYTANQTNEILTALKTLSDSNDADGWNRFVANVLKIKSLMGGIPSKILSDLTKENATQVCDIFSQVAVGMSPHAAADLLKRWIKNDFSQVEDIHIDRIQRILQGIVPYERERVLSSLLGGFPQPNVSRITERLVVLLSSLRGRDLVGSEWFSTLYWLSPEAMLDLQPFVMRLRVVPSYNMRDLFRNLNTLATRDERIAEISRFLALYQPQGGGYVAHDGRAFEVHNYSNTSVAAPSSASCTAPRMMRLNDAIVENLRARTADGPLVAITDVFAALDSKIETMGVDQGKAKAAIRNNSAGADAEILSLVYTFLIRNHRDKIDLWFRAYMDESLNAYGAGGFSCQKGILERVITSLRGIDLTLDAIFSQAEAPELLKRFDASLNIGTPEGIQRIASILRDHGITAASLPEDAARVFVTYVMKHYETYGETPDPSKLEAFGTMIHEHYDGLIPYLGVARMPFGGAGGEPVNITTRDRALNDLKIYLASLDEGVVESTFQGTIDAWIDGHIENSALTVMMQQYLVKNSEVFASSVLRLRQQQAAQIAMEMDQMSDGEKFTETDRAFLAARGREMLRQQQEAQRLEAQRQAELQAQQEAEKKVLYDAAMRKKWREQ